VIDPRRTSSAQWADGWLGLEVGTDIALANAMGREIITAGLANEAFIAQATTDFNVYRARIGPYTLDYAERETGVPAGVIRDLAHTYARADRAMLCWTLGITEHHNAVDNVLALINLALLTGHVGHYGSGLNPLRGQNNVQGGGDMGALPDRLPGFQHVEDARLRAAFERVWGTSLPATRGWHLSAMFEAMARGELTTLYVIGENPAQSEADVAHAVHALEGLEHLVVQDIFLTATAERADVVLPAAASWCEAEGTVTNSERRVQRVRQALRPPGQARDDITILCDLARQLGHDWGHPSAEDVWNEVRRLSPNHAGMSYGRLEALGGLQWPCYDEHHAGTPFLHGRLWERPVQGPRAPFHAVEHEPPVEKLDEQFPIRLTTGRRLDSYNTGVQSSGYHSPLRRGETLDLSPDDARRYGIMDGECVRITSRRGSIVAPVRYDSGLRPGLAFMTLHFQDEVQTNLLTIDAIDPKSGTAEFKAAAIRIDKLRPVERP
jgi:formate dehydrogenase major subunit